MRKIKIKIAGTGRLQKRTRFPRAGKRTGYVKALERDHEVLELENESL
jgi:hypothetical protein